LILVKIYLKSELEALDLQDVVVEKINFNTDVFPLIKIFLEVQLINNFIFLGLNTLKDFAKCRIYPTRIYEKHHESITDICEGWELYCTNGVGQS
jgi:hypothetical protein